MKKSNKLVALNRIGSRRKLSSTPFGFDHGLMQLGAKVIPTRKPVLVND